MNSGVEIGDIVKCLYPESGDGPKLIVRHGTVDKVANWGICVLTPTGYRSLNWHKIVGKIKIKKPIRF